MRKKLNKALSFLIGAATLVSIGFGTAGQKVEAAEGKAAAYKEVIEFEDANNFEQNGQNYIDSSMFHGYSGSGYVYLVSGWSEVNFNIPQSGDYKITVVTNADSYKENWWYLDETQSGALLTSGNQWEPYTVTSYLSAGWHKFGVSAEWGYTALDYCVIESASGGSIVPEGRSMYVKDGRLYDADGDDFIMRGVNVAHAWYTDKTWTSINAIADRGANCVRVVLADGSQWGKTSRQEVENIIAWCEERGLICILEVHDHTGFDKASRLQNAVNYWIALRDLVNAHKDYVIVNIANEWLGTWGMSSHWASTYESAIKTLRNEGTKPSRFSMSLKYCCGMGVENFTSVYSARIISPRGEPVTGNVVVLMDSGAREGAYFGLMARIGETSADKAAFSITALLSRFLRNVKVAGERN